MTAAVHTMADAVYVAASVLLVLGGLGLAALVHQMREGRQ